ncbi:MAG: hypothetical protein ACTSQI_02335 [Candidatus Helarchaeota archaeon]
MQAQSTALLALIFKIIKILLYFFYLVLFVRRSVKKYDTVQPIILEACTSLFFLCMMVGSIVEVYWIATAPLFYDTLGAMYVYFIGFIALAFLSIGIERSANLKTKGLLALVPSIMAILTLYIGIEMLSIPYYFLALIVAIIPALFLYQALVSEGLIRWQFLYIGFGYFLIFAGEAINYKLILLNFPWLESGFSNLTGFSIEFLPPLLVILGLIILFNGYVRLAKKLAI